MDKQPLISPFFTKHKSTSLENIKKVLKNFEENSYFF